MSLCLYSRYCKVFWNLFADMLQYSLYYFRVGGPLVVLIPFLIYRPLKVILLTEWFLLILKSISNIIIKCYLIFLNTVLEIHIRQVKKMSWMFLCHLASLEESKIDVRRMLHLPFLSSSMEKFWTSNPWLWWSWLTRCLYCRISFPWTPLIRNPYQGLCTTPNTKWSWGTSRSIALITERSSSFISPSWTWT